MGTIRAVFRLIIFFLITLLVLVLLAFCKLPFWDKNIYYKIKRKVMPQFARFLAFIVGMDVSVSGEAPQPPFFLVANHLGYIDIIPLWMFTGGTFIAKNEIKSWPFFGMAAKLTGILFIDRGNKRDISRVNALLSEAMNQYQGIILFPEGTSTKGEEVLSFHAPLLQFPAVQKIPVSFASISYCTNDKEKPAAEYICWWGGMTFFKHFFNLLKIKTFNAQIVFGDKKVINENRKELAHVLHQQVKENFTPVVNKPTSSYE